MEECFSYLKDAEIGQRGFLLTKDSIFLEPLVLANNKIDKSLNELASYEQVDPEYVFMINDFITAAKDRIIYINKVVESDRYDKTYIGPDLQVLLKGKLMMDDIRKKMRIIQSKIDVELMARQHIKNQYVTITPLFMIILSVVSISLVYLAYRIIVRELKTKIIIQNDLQYNIDALKRSNAELEQFAYVASHDLQEPLRKIQTFGNRLIVKHKSSLDDDAKFIIDRMQSAAERMQVLINDLLTYSRIVNTGARKLERIDLKKSLDNVLDVLSDVISAKQAKITFDNLPAVLANQTQMEQLFQNLLTNALKFVSPDRQPVIEIKYSLVEGKQIHHVKPMDEIKSFHKISFKDNGIGFDEQYAEKIFVIFQRLQGKSEYSGTGIGLAMCKKIVVNHDGYILAKSKIGKGSEFIVYLPRLL